MPDDLTPQPIQPSLLPQARALATNDLMQRIAADLTPFQAYRVGRQIARRRAQTVEALARIENQTLLTEARIVAEAKVQALIEQTAQLLHAERTDALAKAALRHEEASRIIDLVRDEDAHSVFKDALKGASWRYATSVIKRSGD